MFPVTSLKSLAVKLLVAFAFLLGFFIAFRWGLLPAVQWLFDLNESATAIVRRVGIFTCLVLAYWLYVKIYEKREVAELKLKPTAIAIGALSGAALISLVSLLLFATGVYQVSSYHGFVSGLLTAAGVIFIAATIEEVVFRGILFQALESTWGTIAALWLQSAIFSVLHIANMDSAMGTLELALTVLSGTLIGAFWTLVFVVSRNIWVVAANHAAWNFAVVLTGLPLSGLDDWRAVAPLQSFYEGPNWLTGGIVGPEDSILTVVLMLFTLTALVLWAKKSKQLIPASGRA